MRYYQNTLTGEVVSEDEYSYAAAQKGNWVMYPKIPRYTIETPPYSPGRAEFDEDGKLCYWDDVKDIVKGEKMIENWPTKKCNIIYADPPWEDKVNRIVRLKTGSHYWWRQKHERIWRVCYIGNDPDDNQWLHPIGSPPMKIADMDLSCFDWQEINQPNAAGQGRREATYPEPACSQGGCQ